MKRQTKKQWKYGLIAMFIIFAMTAPGVFKFIEFGTVNEKNQPISWFDPKLSDFFYNDTIDQTSYNFNAHNESYIMCKIQNTPYANFTLDGTIYNVVYGMNYIPLDFGLENKSYTVTFDVDDITNDVYDWFVVQPVIIDSGFIDINPATTTDILFKGAGFVSFFIRWNYTYFNNFTYDDLYVEYDGTVINKIRSDWNHEQEIDPLIVAMYKFGGLYLQYDIHMNPGDHMIKLKGNATVEYKLVVNGDWDGDTLSNSEEIQKEDIFFYADIYDPIVIGMFLKGSAYKVISDYENEYGLFYLHIPKKFKDQTLRIEIFSGSIKNIIVDDDDITFRDINVTNEPFNYPTTLYYGKMSSGAHTISYDYIERCLILIKFYINGTEVLVLESDVSDIDSDELGDFQEQFLGTDKWDSDSDNDGLFDGFDSSPSSMLELNNSKITEIVIPTNKSRDTLITLSIDNLENDYTTSNGSMIWKDMSVSIFPMLRMFGNSTLDTADLYDIFGKNIESFDLTNTNPDYGDGVPDGSDENLMYTLIKPKIAEESISYNFIYDVNNSAKDDSKLIMRFDFQWVVISSEANATRIIHFYDIEEPVILQSFTSKEIDEMNYILASPDSMIENQILWNLIQNPDLGSFSDFGVSSDVVSSGVANYSGIIDMLEGVRESSPISVDENGDIDENEVIYFSYLFSDYDVLQNITIPLYWTPITERTDLECKSEYFVSNYISTVVSNNALMRSILPETNDVESERVLYKKQFGNYSTEESPLEERFNILEYPIYMNNISFQDADILEYTMISGEGIPLDKLPSTIDSQIHDKIMFVNYTIIEDKSQEQQSNVQDISFDISVDIMKNTYDTRILEVPLSDLIFNAYSVSWIATLFFSIEMNGHYYDELTKNLWKDIFIPDAYDIIDDFQLLPETLRELISELPSGIIIGTGSLYSYLNDIADNFYTRADGTVIFIREILEQNLEYQYQRPLQSGRWIQQGAGVDFIQEIRLYLEHQQAWVDDMVARYNNLITQLQDPELFPTMIQKGAYLDEISRMLNYDFSFEIRRTVNLISDVDGAINALDGTPGEINPIFANMGRSRLEQLKGEYGNQLNIYQELRNADRYARRKIIEAKSQWDIDIAWENTLNEYAPIEVYQSKLTRLYIASVATAFISIMVILSAFKDFEAANDALSNNDFGTFLYRTVLGISKMIMSSAALINSYLKIHFFVLGFAYSKSTRKFMASSIKFTGIVAVSAGVFLDFMVYSDYWFRITESDLSPEEKNFWYTFIIVTFALTTAITIVYSIFALSAGSSWIPYVGLAISIISIIILAFVFPDEGPMTGNIDLDNPLVLFPTNNIIRNGGFEVGDEVGFSIDMENSGTATAYMQSKISVGESTYSAWDGDWTNGHETGYGETISVSKVADSTQSSLSIKIHTQIAVDISGKTMVHDKVSENIIPVSILDANIADFYDDLGTDPNSKNQKTYNDLIRNLRKYEETFEHNTTAETAEKLSNPVTYDFLGDSGTPDDWYIYKTYENEYTTILRPDSTITIGDWTPIPSTGNPHLNLNEEVIYPTISSPDDRISETWFGSSAGAVFGVENVNIVDCKQVKEITISIYGSRYHPFVSPWLSTIFANAYWRYNSSETWSSGKLIDLDAYTSGQSPIYTWIELTWSGLDSSGKSYNDLDNLQIYFDAYDGGWMGGAPWLDIEAAYVTVTYESDLSVPTSEIVSKYKGHNNVMNIKALGEYSGTKFYSSLAESSSPFTIDFWLNKNNYSTISVAGLFTIDRVGSILKTDGTGEYIRKRPILALEWTHFSITELYGVEPFGVYFDLYVNGIKLGDAILSGVHQMPDFYISVINDWEQTDPSKGNVSSVYIDAVDYGWSDGYYPWRSFAWDYSLANITKYEDFLDDMLFKTDVSTDLNENIVEMNLGTNEAIFSFDLELLGPDPLNTIIDVFIEDVPDGFTVNDTFWDQNLGATLNFKFTDTGTLKYAGTYFFVLNITSVGIGQVYYEVIPFIVPIDEDLTLTRSNVIYENFDIQGDYTSTDDFLGDTVGTDPEGWYVFEVGGTVNVISSLGDHNNVVEISDTNINSEAHMENNFAPYAYNEGTIEWWYQQNNVDKQSEFMFGNIFAENDDPKIYIGVYQGNYVVYTNDAGTSYKNVLKAENNVWDHHIIQFNNDNFDWYINGVLVATNEDCLGSDRYVVGIHIESGWLDTNYKIYVDAFGYSWDSDYMIGDNKHKTDIIIEDITESQVAKGDIVDVIFFTNTYSEVQMKFVNNDIVQETYTILPRGNGYPEIQSNGFIVDTSITFDEIQFTEYKYNYFDVLQIQITDTLSTVGTLFNPVDITNNGNIPEYVWFDISGVDPENVYSASSPSIVTNVDRNGNIDWSNINNAKIQDDLYASSYLETSGGAVNIEDKVTASNKKQTSLTIPSVTVSGMNVVLYVFGSAKTKQTGTGAQEPDSIVWDSGGVDEAFTQVGFFNDNKMATWIYRLVAPTAKTADITISDASNNWNWDGVVATALVLSGVHQISPDDGFNSVSGDSSAASVSITSESGDIVFDVLSVKDETPSVDGSQIQLWNQASPSKVEGAGSYEAGDTSVNMDWTFTSTDWGISGININPAGSGGDSVESDWLRFTNFDFNIPDDAIITGIAVEIDAYASVASTIKDYSIRLRKPDGEVSTIRNSIQYWDMTDDDSYNVHGGLDDTWDLHLTDDDVNNVNFGVDIAVENLGATSTAFIDHVIVKVYYSSFFTTEILPGETIEINFDIIVPTESENNIIHRGVTYQTLGSNIINRYYDNFEIDGIYISSPLNTTYNVIGNNFSCNKDEISLEIIPEDTLVWSAYSLNGAANITFTGSANVTIPETNGMHSIQVFGNNSIGTMFQSELRNFTIQYPIGIISPNETENTVFHGFLEDYDLFDSNDVNSNPNNWTVLDADNNIDTLYISGVSLDYGTQHEVIANAQTDDSNYFYITSEEVYGEYMIIGSFTFNIEPNYRDFLVSYNMDIIGIINPIYLTVNEIVWKSGDPLDSDNMFKSGINTIEISASNTFNPFQINIYFFKMIDQTNEGNVEVIDYMNAQYKLVQISNADYDTENSMKRDLPDNYETGNISFSILRESIIDKNTALITLEGTSGTMVYTLENDDLYHGSYATKTLLASDVLKSGVWQDFVIFFNISEGCQIFVDGEKYVPVGEEYAPFSTGTPTDINTFKIETVYHSGEDYSFWFDDFIVNKIDAGFMIDIFNWFIDLNDLKYSFDEGTKKSFVDKELFSFPTPGLHNITIYGTDIYGDEYRSEKRFFTTEETYQISNITEHNAMPIQWSEFTYTYGSSGGTGSTEYDDDIYAYMNPEATVGSESSVYSDPESDAYNQGWVVTPLEPKIDDAIRYPSTTGFSGGYIEGEYADFCYFNMEDVVIPVNNYLTKIVVWMYSSTDDPEWYEYMEADIRFNGYTGWINDQFIGQTGWSWDSVTWNFAPGAYSDVHADALQVRIQTGRINSDNTVWRVETMYAQIYYAPVTFRHTSIINTTIPLEELDEIKTFYYDYATTSSLDCDLDIYNFDTETWYELESNTGTNYVTNSFSLTDSYLSNTGQIQIRFETAIGTSDFDIRLDQLMVTYDAGPVKEL